MFYCRKETVPLDPCSRRLQLMIQFSKMSTRILSAYERLVHSCEWTLIEEKVSRLSSAERGLSSRARVRNIARNTHGLFNPAPYEMTDLRTLRRIGSEYVPQHAVFSADSKTSDKTSREERLIRNAKSAFHHMALLIRAFPGRLYSRVAHERAGSLPSSHARSNSRTTPVH